MSGKGNFTFNRRTVAVVPADKIAWRCKQVTERAGSRRGCGAPDPGLHALTSVRENAGDRHDLALPAERVRVVNQDDDENEVDEEVDGEEEEPSVIREPDE